VLLLIVAVVVAYNPVARADVVETWQNIKPDLVQFMDSFYAAIRDILAGSGSDNHIEDEPDPGANFQRVITVNSSFVF